MAASRKSKPKAPPKAKRKVRTPGDPVGAALAAVKAGKIDDALAPLLVQWRLGVAGGSATDELAEAIDVISRRRKAIPEIRGKKKVAIDAWNDVAERGDPFDLGSLLAALPEVDSGLAAKRLAVLVERFAPDPRIDAALVDLLHAIPYRATSTQPFWNSVFLVLTQTRDRRQLARLATANADEVAITMGDWLRKKMAALRATLDDRFREPPAPPDPRLAEIAAAVGSPKLSVGSRNIEALLQAIYASPDDDAPRLVYADALLERGDPRGEHINLQIANSPALRPESSQASSSDREAKRREKELFETHGKQWLGDLAPIVMAGFTFERGFLASCKIENKFIDRVRALAGHPAWSTVHTLEGSATIALHPVMKALRRLSFVSWQARNRTRDAAHLTGMSDNGSGGTHTGVFQILWLVTPKIRTSIG